MYNHLPGCSNYTTATEYVDENGKPWNWLITPDKTSATSPDLIVVIEDSIRRITGIEEPIYNYTSSALDVGLILWSIPSLTTAQKEEVERIPGSPEMITSMEDDTRRITGIEGPIAKYVAGKPDKPHVRMWVIPLLSAEQEEAVSRIPGTQATEISALKGQLSKVTYMAGADPAAPESTDTRPWVIFLLRSGMPREQTDKIGKSLRVVLRSEGPLSNYTSTSPKTGLVLWYVPTLTVAQSSELEKLPGVWISYPVVRAVLTSR
ncbi:hypothetical protein LTR95_001220 [Oleoguttula sp. CCFEE 5521]